MRVLVFQSAPDLNRSPWIDRSLASVRGWALAAGFEYRFLGDNIFDCIEPKLREKFERQTVVLSDLARLLMTRRFLASDFDTVIWADSDFLVFAPDDLTLPSKSSFAFGREVWVQEEDGKLRSHKKLHNAFFLFQRENPFLDFYIHAAEAMLNRSKAPVVPQFIGPKFLSVQHNLIGMTEIPSAAMFSPLVLSDILSGGGDALALMAERQGAPIGGANLSLSHVGRSVDGVTISDDDAGAVVEALLSKGLPL